MYQVLTEYLLEVGNFIPTWCITLLVSTSLPAPSAGSGVWLPIFLAPPTPTASNRRPQLPPRDWQITGHLQSGHLVCPRSSPVQEAEKEQLSLSGEEGTVSQQ